MTHALSGTRPSCVACVRSVSLVANLDLAGERGDGRREGVEDDARARRSLGRRSIPTIENSDQLNGGISPNALHGNYLFLIGGVNYVSRDKENDLEPIANFDDIVRQIRRFVAAEIDAWSDVDPVGMRVWAKFPVVGPGKSDDPF
ncbi:MAG: hypothetical protein ABSA66_20330 [Roseiarcus sp.]